MKAIVLTREPREQTFDWGRLTWFVEGPHSEHQTVGRCILKPGRGNPRHRHPNCEEVLTVLSGSIRHTGPEGEWVPMQAGESVTIPANVWHHAENTGEGEAVLLIAFSSPNRETEGEAP